MAKNKARANIYKASYEEHATSGQMPADPMQKAINAYPPIDESEHIKNSKVRDKYKANKQTKEQKNLKNIIGDPAGGAELPSKVRNQGVDK